MLRSEARVRLQDIKIKPLHPRRGEERDGEIANNNPWQNPREFACMHALLASSMLVYLIIHLHVCMCVYSIVYATLDSSHVVVYTRFT